MRLTTALLVISALFGVALSTVIRKQKLALGSYNDPFARFKMFSFSAAAYADQPNLCLKSVYPTGNSTVQRVIEVICDTERTDSCRGFAAVSNEDKAIILSFRGTSQFLQLIQETVHTIFSPKEFIGGGMVSNYFYNAFLTVWKAGLKEDYLQLRNKHPDYEVWVTGHSLGGAMASLCAATLAHEGLVNPEKMKMMTFGQPRVGDRTYADAHHALVQYSYRVVHNRDLVPHVPPENFPDNGLFDGYVHHESEVFYENDMAFGSDYKTCNSDESWKCSDGFIFTLSIPDHLHYFQHEEFLTDYGEDGCPLSMVKK